MNYCDDCIHNDVCKYVKDVRKYEDQPITYVDGSATGPVLHCTVNCPSKLVGEIVRA